MQLSKAPKEHNKLWSYVTLLPKGCHNEFFTLILSKIINFKVTFDT